MSSPSPVYIVNCQFHIASSKQPTLPDMYGGLFDVPKEVGNKYTLFGTFLLNDEDGKKMEIIINNYRGMAREITRAILKEWLEGNGSEVSWKSLIATLRKCELSPLANRIHLI